MKKRILCSLLSLCLIFSIIKLPSSVSAEDIIFDFEEDSIGESPAGFICGEEGGKVSVVDSYGHKSLFISNDFEGRQSVARRNISPISAGTIYASFEFLQPNPKTDGSVIFALQASGTNVVVLETKDGGIYYKTKSGYEAILENYYADIWYGFEIEVNLDSSVATIYVDGEYKNSLSLLATGQTINSILHYTKYSPGFMIDNISIKSEKTIGEIKIKGQDNIPVSPYAESIKASYEVEAIDPVELKKIEIQNAVWTISPQVAGISIDAAGGTAEITVDPDCSYRGILNLSAEVEINNEIRNLSKTILIENAKPTTIKISGEGYIYEGMENIYTAEVLDSVGNVIPEEEIEWSLETPFPYVEFDSYDGTLRINSNYVEGDVIVLKARSASASVVVAEKNILVTDIQTYSEDNGRFNVLKTWFENVMELQSDPYRNTPLIAEGYNFNSGLPTEWKTSQDPDEIPAALCNFGQSGCMFRIFDFLTEVTGDEKYTDRIDAAAEYFLENHVSDNNLPIWGGHLAVDLKTGGIIDNYQYDHELKDASVYWAPYFRVDSEKTSTVIKSIWLAHVSDFKTLCLNRHGSLTADTALTDWNNINKYTDASYATGYIGSAELPFRSAGNDFINAALALYENTGDEKALNWAKRLITRYHSCADPETKLGGEIFTNPNLNPSKLTLPENWWLEEDPTLFNRYSQWASYGDRFYNQFADTMVKVGRVPASKKETLIQGNAYMFDLIESFHAGCHTNFYFADVVGRDSEFGKELVDFTIKKYSNYIKYAYKKDTNQLKYIMADGTPITGIPIERSGYYGTAHGVNLGYDTPTDDMFRAMCYVYLQAVKHGYTEEAETIWNFITNYAYFNELGNLGESAPGDSATDVNLYTTNKSPAICIALLSVYEATKNVQFLDMARKIADNFIEEHVKNGLVVMNKDHVNAYFGTYTYDYAYALAYLKAATEMNFEVMPRYFFADGYYDGYYANDRNTYTRQRLGGFAETFKSIYVTDIEFAWENLVLSTGESKKLEYKIYPDDASSKSLVYYGYDPTIVSINTETRQITALKKGTTTVSVISGDLKVKTKFSVEVKEGAE